MVSKSRYIGLVTITVMCSIGFSACQSSSPPQSDSQTPQPTEQTTMQEAVDYTGNWMTGCLPFIGSESRTIRLVLSNDGEYRLENYRYDGQDCDSPDNQTRSSIETGTYTLNSTVEVPSGVVAQGVALSGISRVINGEQIDISGDPDYNDIMHRDGNTLIRAKPNLTGVAAYQISEELDFDTVYYLQE